MKIRNKLGLLLGGALLIFTIIILVIIGFELIWSSRTEIEVYREREIKRYQQVLINYVDLAYHSIESQAARSEDKQYLIEKYGDRLRNTVETAESIIKAELDKAENGIISRAEAIETAKELIRAFRYDKGTGYLWINDTVFPYPNMVMHPTIPTLEGTKLDSPSYNVAMGIGKNLFQAFIEETADEGEGFVDYTWPRPTENGLTEDQPKLSYVKRIDELNWIIGTGIYVSDALADIKSDALLQLEMMRYDGGVGYYWVNDTGKPYPEMIMHPVLPDLNGTVMDDSKYNVVGDEKKNLFKAFVDETEDDNEGFVRYLWPKPLDNGMSEDQPKLSYVKRFPEWNWIIGTGFYIDDLDKSVAAKEKEAMLQLRRSILLILLSAFLLAAFFIFIAYRIISRMVRPVSDAAEMFEQMSSGEGDLSVKLIKKSNDEAGEMALNFNSFLEKLKRIVINLKDAVNSTESVKNSLGETAEYTAEEVKKINSAVLKMEKRIALLDDRISQSDAGTEEVDKRLERLSSRIENETSAVEKASQSVNHIVNYIKDVALISRQRSNAMDKLIASARTGSELQRTTSRAVNDINGKIEGIKEMVDLIENISSQTNLLAMNAAIEAAHAGDAGKGFAVVADEITKLAESTNESSQQISHSLEEIVETVRKAGEASEQTSKTFLDVEDEVGHVTESLEEITRSTGEISLSGDGVISIMKELGDLSEGVSRDASIIGNQSRNIKQGMGEAEEVSKGIRRSINSVASGMEEIARVMDKLLALTEDLTNTSESMNRQVKKFKTE